MIMYRVSFRQLLKFPFSALLKSVLCAVLISVSINAYAQQWWSNPALHWADSYSRGGICWIDSTFDHGIGSVGVRTNEGLKTVRQISAAQDKIRLPRRASDPRFNDVQCGHGPANNDGDEDQGRCPGRVDQGSAGCSVKGPTWNLEVLFPGKNVAPKPESLPAPAPAPMAKTLPAAACFTTGQTARADFTAKCGNVARDCDPIVLDGSLTQMCANFQLGSSAPPGVPPKDMLSSVDLEPQPEPEPVPELEPQPEPINITNLLPEQSEPLVSAEPSVSAGVCEARGSNFSAAVKAYANSCPNIPRRDCDLTDDMQWTCSSVVIGSAAPSLSGVVTSTPRASTKSAASTNNAIGRVGSNDLVALHYDNCPDRDDGHALAAGKAVIVNSGLSNIVIVNGTCGDSVRSSYQPDSEQVVRALWGNQWLDAYNDLDASIQTSVERWVSVLSNGGDVWVAEGGPSDFTAKVLRSIRSQFPTLNLKNVHVVQHSTGSGFNEAKTTQSNLQLVKAVADYITIPNGNIGGNGSAGLNGLSSFFVDIARQSALSNEWGAAFNYMNPNERLDFSDTVELLYITNDTSTQSVDDFARNYLR